MNWGKGITIVMALFMGFISVLVAILMSHNVDLESEDYYKKEIAYEQEITAMKNYKELTEQVKITTKGDFLIVQFPDQADNNSMYVKLTRPNDSSLDKKFTLQDTKILLISKKELAQGIYQVDLAFKVQEEDCLQKEKIRI